MLNGIEKVSRERRECPYCPPLLTT